MAQASWHMAKLFARGVDDATPRILPFALFMAFIALESLIRWLAGLVPSAETATSPTLLWLYPLRTAVVLGALLYLWPAYQELRDTLCSNMREALLVSVVGILVYVAWVRMDGPGPCRGSRRGTTLSRQAWAWASCLRRYGFSGQWSLSRLWKNCSGVLF